MIFHSLSPFQKMISDLSLGACGPSSLRSLRDVLKSVAEGSVEP